uniref:Uncharacterized protein n=1 Tax=Octopus bimaculoides TaxID=37653 RepID=A0A0L8FN46_OCTBM
MRLRLGGGQEMSECSHLKQLAKAWFMDGLCGVTIGCTVLHTKASNHCQLI